MNRGMYAGIALLLATQAHAAPFPVQSTEERNAAVGFTVTLSMAIRDALGRHCAALKGDVGGTSLGALSQWQARNRDEEFAAYAYLAVMEGQAEQAQGTGAGAAFRAERKAEFAQGARETQLAWFPEALVDEARCQQVVALVESGVYDVGRHPKVAASLSEIAVELAQLQGDLAKPGG